MRLVSAVFLSTCVLAGCSPPAALDAGDAYVRLPAVAGRPAAAYFTVHGGPADTTLMSVGSTVAIKTEMHESMTSGATGGAMGGAMSGMKPLRQIVIPAAADVAFAPGGRHVMLFDMNPGIKKASIVPLVFQFSNGVRFERKARAIAAGDPPPES